MLRPPCVFGVHATAMDVVKSWPLHKNMRMALVTAMMTPLEAGSTCATCHILARTNVLSAHAGQHCRPVLPGMLDVGPEYHAEDLQGRLVGEADIVHSSPGPDGQQPGLLDVHGEAGDGGGVGTRTFHRSKTAAA